MPSSRGWLQTRVLVLILAFLAPCMLADGSGPGDEGGEPGTAGVSEALRLWRCRRGGGARCGGAGPDGVEVHMHVERLTPFERGEVVRVRVEVLADRARSLAGGQVLHARLTIDGVRTNEEPSPFPPLGDDYRATTLMMLIDTEGIMAGERVVRCDVLARSSGLVIASNTTNFSVLSRGGGGEADAPPELHSSSSLAACMRRGAVGACGVYLRQRLWGVPAYVSQVELAFLRNISPTFFGLDINSTLLSKFPRDSPQSLLGRCAVVGSAGHLLGSHLGQEIDAHDVVLRFNDAPAGAHIPGAHRSEMDANSGAGAGVGIGVDVGTRTTHRMVHAATSVVSFLQGPGGWAQGGGGEELIFRGDWLEDARLMMRMHKAEERRSEASGRPRRGMWMLSMAFNLFSWQCLGARGTDRVPTSGMLGILWSLQRCDSVDTYGFGALEGCAEGGEGGGGGCRNRSNGYRYYENQEHKEALRHGEPLPTWDVGHSWKDEEDLHAVLAEGGHLRRRWTADPDS